MQKLKDIFDRQNYKFECFWANQYYILKKGFYSLWVIAGTSFFLRKREKQTDRHTDKNRSYSHLLIHRMHDLLAGTQYALDTSSSTKLCLQCIIYCSLGNSINLKKVKKSCFKTKSTNFPYCNAQNIRL